MVKPVYNTLDDIQQRKDALLTDIQKDSEHPMARTDGSPEVRQ